MLSQNHAGITSAGFTQTCGDKAARVHADIKAKWGQTKYWSILTFINIYGKIFTQIGNIDYYEVFFCLFGIINCHQEHWNWYVSLLSDIAGVWVRSVAICCTTTKISFPSIPLCSLSEWHVHSKHVVSDVSAILACLIILCGRQSLIFLTWWCTGLNPAVLLVIWGP